MIATNHCDIQEQNKDMLVLLASLVVQYRLLVIDYFLFLGGTLVKMARNFLLWHEFAQVKPTDVQHRGIQEWGWHFIACACGLSKLPRGITIENAALSRGDGTGARRFNHRINCTLLFKCFILQHGHELHMVF